MPEKDASTGQFLKTAKQTNVPLTGDITITDASPITEEFGIDAEKLKKAMKLLAQMEAQEKIEAEEKEAARLRAETGYPKALYNSKFSGESIALPDTLDRLTFYRARLMVDDAETEEYVRKNCPGRIYEQDMKEEKICNKCGNVYGSTDAWTFHMETQHVA